ncbi:hypothetical protein ACHAXA_009478 [Cyclostephanos tholiformis]|uniref:Glycolipid transfer protein domain-containing protein n=1 Tax=Cyclostephanos tholiformis TaxID=382380 RepID=A0ABD3RBU2_9STRA
MRSTHVSLISILLIGPAIAGDRSMPWRIVPLPFLRGGAVISGAVAAKQRSTRKRQQVRRATRGGRVVTIGPIVQLVDDVLHGLGEVGDRIKIDVSNFGKGIGREWDRLTSLTTRFVANARLPFPPFVGRRRKGLLKSTKLDEVCQTFATVLRSGDEVDTVQLLRACRAHVDLMKTGGPSLRLVARDLESNVKKAEEAFRMSPRDGKHLSTLLERERGRGLHNGSELHERSAAMGLLWIRRSLQFQLDLYACLASGIGHPRDAAYDAYERHLAPYHGWALQKIFPASLSQMPDRRAFLAKFAGIEIDDLSDEHDREIARKLRSLIGTWDPLLSSWKGAFERLGLEDTRRV